MPQHMKSRNDMKFKVKQKQWIHLLKRWTRNELIWTLFGLDEISSFQQLCAAMAHTHRSLEGFELPFGHNPDITTGAKALSLSS